VALPNIKKDAAGNFYLEGIQEREISQSQFDFNEISQASQFLTGPNGDAARKAISSNADISAGVIAGLYNNGSIGSSPLVDTFVAIDKATQAARTQDQFKANQQATRDNNNKTIWGKATNALRSTGEGVYTAAKNLSRLGVSTLYAPMETFFNGLGNQIGITAKEFQLQFQGKIDWQGNPTNPSDTRESLGLLSTKDQLNVLLNPAIPIKQTQAFQIAKEGIRNKGKVDLGTGFFLSEETGAGFAARQEKIKYAKIPVMQGDVQAKDANGNLVYRPYSPIDPASFLITKSFGWDEGNARFINAIGELGLMVVGDPVVAFGKLARTKKQLEEAKAFNNGMLPAKQLQKLTLLETQVDEAQKAVESSLAQMGVFTGQTKGEKVAAYRAALADQTKIEANYTGAIDQNINYEPIAAFLSGSSGSHIIDTIANLDDWKQIYRVGRKGGRPGFTVDQAKVLAAATNRDEVLKALAPFVASGTVAQNMLETGNTTSRFLNKIIAGKSPRAAQAIQGWAVKGINKIPIIKKQLTGLSEAYSTYVPSSGAFVHYADKDALVETIINYGRSMKVPDATINSIIDGVAYGTDASTSGYQAVTKLFNSVFESNKAAFAAAGIDSTQLQKLTKIFDDERKAQSSYWAELHASGANIEFALVDGKTVNVSGAHLDSEFLNSMIYFPAPKEILNELSKISKLGKATKGYSAKVIQPIDAFTGGFWKKVVLTRPAYVIRNITEEQIRVMATGHVSFFNHPGMAISMWLGREGGPKWKSLLNTYDPYRHTVFGDQLKLPNSSDELLFETMSHQEADGYIGLMRSQEYGTGNEITKVSSLRGYKNVQSDEPRFWEGLANEIRILQASPIAKAVARTRPGYEFATIDYLLRGKGNEAWTRFVSSRNEEVKAWLSTDAGARAFLFDGVTKDGRAASVRARIEEVAGQGGPSSAGIRKLIADGKFETGGYSLAVPTAEDSARNSIKNSQEISKNRKSIKDANEEFADQLKKTFEGQGDWKGIRFKVGDNKTVLENNDGRINQMINGFFNYTTRLEKTSTMGPEWRMKYWDTARGMILAADENALKVLKDTAEKSLRPLTNPNGLRIGDKHAAWNILNKAKGDGPLTIDEIHEYASRVASQHTKELFYSASKKRLLWHQLRLVAPFGNAWGDTIHKWSRLALDNPDQVYKISRGLNWVNSPTSSALYEITDAKDYYDPNQGFFFTDPLSQQKQFFVPFMSTGMNFMTNLFSKGKISGQGAFGAGSNPQSFNFALGSGMVLPGFGPGISLSLTVLDSLGINPLDLLPTVWKDDLYKVVYPFGTTDLSVPGQAISAATSSNIGRLFAGVTGSKESYAASFSPVMNYLASSGDYNIDDPEDQVRLVADTNHIAQWFTVTRAMFGFVSPVSIQPKDLVKDKSGSLLLASALYNDFKEIQKANGTNQNKSYADFLDIYGPEQVFAIISATTGGPTNLLTYKLIQRDPSVIDDYKDTYGYFYPNGGFSQELYSYQLRNDKRERLTAQEILDKATNIRFYAAKDRLLTRSVSEGWDSKRFSGALADLGDSYQIRNRTTTFDATKQPRILAQLTKASTDPRFIDSDAVNGLRDYLLLRNKALTASGRKTLKNESSLPQREWLANEALKLVIKYPDFQKIYYSFFKKELEG
jgi:hypothetical protein